MLLVVALTFTHRQLQSVVTGQAPITLWSGILPQANASGGKHEK